jgi:hypothetical protein
MQQEGLRRLRPNPSLKRSANGRPPGPAWRYAYIFASPGLASCRRRPLSSNVRQRSQVVQQSHPSNPASAACEKVHGNVNEVQAWSGIKSSSSSNSTNTASTISQPAPPESLGKSWDAKATHLLFRRFVVRQGRWHEVVSLLGSRRAGSRNYFGHCRRRLHGAHRWHLQASPEHDSGSGSGTVASGGRSLKPKQRCLSRNSSQVVDRQGLFLRHALGTRDMPKRCARRCKL